jgi:hypothetical protein
VEHDVLEADATLLPELRFFASSQAKYFDGCITTCAQKAYIGIGSSVPTSVPKRGPRTIIRQPTPTKFPIKNGPEIVNFRPVL